ncbi:MAG: hypothetical protein HY822_23025 [Acidobacteria bacterium]|nr:hypothetical protein [Acidobacteriota bacterium]
MTTGPSVCEEGLAEWDAQELLQSISDQLRGAAPLGCCVHGEDFCLSCSLAWAVEQNIPLHLGGED